ncbi:MAG TPA: phosphotransferase [Rhizomicrobium sp.]|nr:phosphotransferase [Rhizomicrobium sp.]
MDAEPLSATLATHPTPIASDSAQVFLRRTFGIDGELRALRSERDENFLVEAGGERYVLKFASPAEDRDVTHFQTNVLLHIAAKAPDVPIPRPVNTSSGRSFAEYTDPDGDLRLVRLFTFLPGTMVADVEITPALRTNIGFTLARVDKALESFSDPSPSYDLSWDLERAARLRPLLADVEERTNRRLVEQALDIFESRVAPELQGLRRQVIHNDLNPFNVLVDPVRQHLIVGVLDFGDIVRAPLVHDIAIAASYHIGAAENPLQPVAEMLSGYQKAVKLEQLEIDLLPDLIATRLAMTVLITEWRARQFPENRAYILKNHPASVAGLTRLARISRGEAVDFLRRVGAER